MILCDFGNTTVDIFVDGIRHKIGISDFDPTIYEGDVWYASVNMAINQTLVSLPRWHNIADLIEWTKYYPTMGIDRILVCEAVETGVVVDAGSAITVDIMHEGHYQGGFISLGLRAAKEAYAGLSPALAVSFNFEVDLDKMAKNTPDAVTVGFLSPLIHEIGRLGKPLYVCGGDAPLFSRFFVDAAVDEALVFKGMVKLIEKGHKC